MKSRKQYISAARITTSIEVSGSREDGQGAVDGQEQGLAVLQLHVGGAVPDVGRVRLELHVELVALADGHVSQVERERAVSTRLTDRRRLDRVDRVALEPALAENERRLLQILVRADREPRLPEEAAADPRRRVDLQIGLGTRRPGGGGPLPERIQESRQNERREQGEQAAAHPDMPAA